MSGTTLVVRPASKLLSGTDWTVTGAADAATALSDNSDASYVQSAAASAGYLKQAFADFTLPTLAQIRTVRPDYRFRFAAGGPGFEYLRTNMSVIDVFGTEDFESFEEVLNQSLGLGFATLQGLTRATDPLNNQWTLLTLQSLRVQFRTNLLFANSQCQMAALYLNVLYNLAPAITATAPTGTITATTRPQVTWTYVDPEGDAQERYQIFVFTAAQIAAASATITNKALTSNVATLTTSLAHGYSVGDTATVASVDATFNGNYLVSAVPTANTFSYAKTHADVGSTSATGTSFSPNHGGSPFWSTGELYGSVVSVTPFVDLPNDTYSAYITTADAGSNGRYGIYGVTSFTVALTPPPAPSLTATYDSTNIRNVLTAQAATNLASANQSDVETDVSGLFAAGNSTVSRSTLQASSGVASLAVKSVASGTMQARTTGGTSGWPVVGSQTYTGYTELRSAVSTRTCRVGIDWYDATGAYISTTYSSTAVDSTSAWTIYRPTGTSPSNAAFADIIVEIQSTGAANETHYADKIGMWPGSGTTWTRGDLSGPNERIVIEFSDDSGTTWAAVRGSPFTPSTYQTTVGYDYELPSGIARIYRARVASIDSVGNVLNSNNSASTSPLTYTLARPLWRLVDPLTPAHNVFIRPTLPDEEAVESLGTFRPLGRWDSVVVSSAIGVDPAAVVVAGDGTLSCTTLTEAEALTLRGAFFARNALYLISPSGSQNRYIRLLSPRKFPRNGGSLARTWSAPFVSVRRP